jgi:phosphoribosyl-ATP pyrophosphohydrolase/phosphoribosyl-AMP cyclohydrolase/histidinol dehydrogenase
MLKIIPTRDIPTLRTSPVAPETLAVVAPIVADVAGRGEPAVREYAERFGEVVPGDAIVLDRAEIARRASTVAAADLELLRRVATRITTFARAQRDALRPFELAVPGGRAGQTLIPVDSAGCYAPGGRYPLPSSVLMTACVARAAGVRRVVVASPKPAPITYAAALVADADEMLVVGGAHAVAAMAYGLKADVPREGVGRVFTHSRSVNGGYQPNPQTPPAGSGCDLIVGPGNKYVTAAKKLVQGIVGIDMLAGPSELVVLHTQGSANAATIAADLLAQAEHDDDARPILVTTSRDLARDVSAQIESQIHALPEPNRTTARRACANGFIALADTLDDAITAVDFLAPEHLEILADEPHVVAARVHHAGACFLGEDSAEVFGDYGLGPNHTLPTGGSARFGAGLSVYTFLRARTWIRLDPGSENRVTKDVITDTARLARLEGLEAHARAAERRAAP